MKDLSSSSSIPSPLVRLLVGLGVVAALSVACSSPPPAGKDAADQTSGDGADDDDVDGDKAAPTDTKSDSSPVSPKPTNEDDEDDEDDEDAAAEACFDQCLAGNAAAKQMSAQMDACWDQCDDDDDACEDKCDASDEQICNTNVAACDFIDDCDTKCFGDEDD